MSTYPIYRPRRLRAMKTYGDWFAKRHSLLMTSFIRCSSFTGMIPRSKFLRCRVAINIRLTSSSSPQRNLLHSEIPGTILFGIPASKNPLGTEAYADDGIIQQAVRAIKDAVPDLLVMTDVCLCEYTDHGHCGVIEAGEVPKRSDAGNCLLKRAFRTHVPGPM